MKPSSAFPKIYLCSHSVDFRMGLYSLLAFAQGYLLVNMTDAGNLTVFFNKRRNAVKCIYWDHTGYAMWHKALEKNLFPKVNIEPGALVLELESIQLDLFLSGIDFIAHKTHKKKLFSALY